MINPGKALFALSILSIVSPLPALISGFILWQKLKLYCKPVVVLLLVGFLVEILSVVIALYLDKNLTVFHFYTVVELVLWCLFYKLFFNSGLTTKVIYSLIFAFAILVAFDFALSEKEKLGNPSLSTEALIMLGLSFYLFLFVMRNQLTEDLLSEPFFWINCAVLIYFSGNALLFLFEKFLNDEQIWRLWAPIHNVLNIILNCLIFIGFLKSKKIWKS